MLKMIDLSGLKTIADVTIRADGRTVDAEFSMVYAKWAADFMNDLKRAGLMVFPGAVPERSVVIYPGNYCPTQLAEQVAIELERSGLVVRRLVPEPGDADRSPRKEVQSFILA